MSCPGRWFDRNGESVGTLANESVCEESPVRVGETGRRLAIRRARPQGRRQHPPLGSAPIIEVSVYDCQRTAGKLELGLPEGGRPRFEAGGGLPLNL